MEKIKKRSNAAIVENNSVFCPDSCYLIRISISILYENSKTQFNLNEILKKL